MRSGLAIDKVSKEPGHRIYLPLKPLGGIAPMLVDKVNTRPISRKLHRGGSPRLNGDAKSLLAAPADHSAPQANLGLFRSASCAGESTGQAPAPR